MVIPPSQCVVDEVLQNIATALHNNVQTCLYLEEEGSLLLGHVCLAKTKKMLAPLQLNMA
jgi:hypothetical protein